MSAEVSKAGTSERERERDRESWKGNPADADDAGLAAF